MGGGAGAGAGVATPPPPPPPPPPQETKMAPAQNAKILFIFISNALDKLNHLLMVKQY